MFEHCTSDSDGEDFPATCHALSGPVPTMCWSHGDNGSLDEEDDACHDRGDHKGEDSEEMDSAAAGTGSVRRSAEHL